VLPGKKYTPEEIIRIALRRKWLIILPLLVGTAAGVVVFRKMPKQYRSETLIMVVPQRIPDTYVKPTVTATVQDRLTSISDQIMSRSRLERIILDLDLYRDMRANGIMEDIVQRMRGDIKPSVDGKEATSFRVSYVSRDPKTAQKVTERLASLYIEENLRDRTNLAESTNQFLESQLEDAKRRLIEHEKKLEEYRRAHSGQLPSQLQTNLQAIQNAQLQLQSVSESINRARERRLLLERQLADTQTLPLAVIQPNAATTNPEAGAPTAAQQLETAQARLELVRLRYTEDHPDVKSLQRTIAELQFKADEEAKKPPTATTDKPVSPAEAARQKRVRDLQADIEMIDRQVTTGLAEETRLKSVIADYQAKVDVVPSRESDLIELTRDYTTLQETYSSLLKKREDSKLAANLESRQIGEQFKVLDPASLPERPYNQNQRLTALAGGAIGGLVLGLAFIGLLEMRDSSFKNEEDVLRVLTLPVLALVPVMLSESDRRRLERRRKRRLVMAVTATLVLIVSAAAVLWKMQL
jgi:polysaccharide chain length determinant protein (PEP-CTERM system associated)